MISLSKMSQRDSTSQWTPTTNVFVNYIPKHWTKAELVTLLAPYGIIVSAKVMIDLKTGASRCFGFVRFTTVESAIQAILGVNGMRVGNKRLLARFASSVENTGAPTRRLFIKSLPLWFTLRHVFDMYSPFGSIEDIELVFNPSTKRFAGAAYVLFTSRASAQLAQRETNNVTLCGDSWPLFIQYVDDTNVKANGAITEMVSGIRIERRLTRKQTGPVLEKNKVLDQPVFMGNQEPWSAFCSS